MAGIAVDAVGHILALLTAAGDRRGHLAPGHLSVFSSRTGELLRKKVSGLRLQGAGPAGVAIDSQAGTVLACGVFSEVYLLEPV